MAETVSTGISITKAVGVNITVTHNMTVAEVKDLISDLITRVAEVDDISDIVLLAKKLANNTNL